MRAITALAKEKIKIIKFCCFNLTHVSCFIFNSLSQRNVFIRYCCNFDLLFSKIRAIDARANPTYINHRKKNIKNIK